MTEKKFFAYKPFFPLNISDFNFFFVKIATTPLKKVTPRLSQQPPSKRWGPVKPRPHFENLVGGSFIQARRKKDRIFHFHPSTNIQTFGYQDVYSLFLIDVFAITELIADELYRTSGFTFNLTRTKLFWELEDWRGA